MTMQTETVETRPICAESIFRLLQSLYHWSTHTNVLLALFTEN